MAAAVDPELIARSEIPHPVHASGSRDICPFRAGLTRWHKDNSLISLKCHVSFFDSSTYCTRDPRCHPPGTLPHVTMALSRHGNRRASSHSEIMPTGHLSQSGVISVFGATSSPRRTHDCHLSSCASLTPPPRCRTGPTINLTVFSTFSGKALSRYRRKQNFSDGDIAPSQIFHFPVAVLC